MSDARPSLPLAVLVTGDPVARARAASGDFAQMIQRTIGNAWQGPWRVVDARREANLPHPGELAGVVITGSAAFVSDDVAWMKPTLQYVSQIAASELPCFGICFGHQLLGQALGGRVARNPRGREIGTLALSRVGDATSVLGEAPRSEFLVHMTHLDSVVELPPGAKLLGATAQDPAAFVQFGERAWGVQFHPELDEAAIRGYIEERSGSLRSEGFDPDDLLSKVQHTPISHELLGGFAAYCFAQLRSAA